MRARALMKFLWESAQIFPVLSYTVPALFISFDLKCTVRFSLKMPIFVVPFSVAYVNIPSVIKNYTSKGASRLFYITLRERLVPNIVLLNDAFLIEQWRLILCLNFKTWIFNAILHKNCGVPDLGTRRIELSTAQNVSLYRNILFCKFGQRR